MLAGILLAMLLTAATLGVFKGRREPEGREQVGEDETGDLGDDPVLDPEHVQRERLVRRVRWGPQIPGDRGLSVGLRGYAAQRAAKAGGARIENA